MLNLLYIGLGGFIGAVLRAVCSEFFNRYFTKYDIPFGTLMVNLLGCLFIGLFFGSFASDKPVNIETRIFFVTGILGGFTTFSAFGYETYLLLSGGKYLVGLLNVALQVLVGLVMVGAGMMIAGMRA